jgi:heptosyltransferase I
VKESKRGEPKHLCVVLLTGLGDVVMGLPAVNAIRDHNPRLRITWIAEPMPAGMLEGHSSVDQVVQYRRSDGVRGVRQLWRDLRAVPPIDVTLNMNVYFKSVWPTLLSRAPRRIGFERGRSFDGVWLASNEHLPEAPRAHTADMLLEFASYLGADISRPEWRLEFTAAERETQRLFFEQFGGSPVAAIVPASSTHKKDWVASRWAEVADSLARDFGFSVVVAGGPGARENAIAREIQATSKEGVVLAMGHSVRWMAAVLGRSALVIGPDTGPLHVARALSIPVIGLYGHTNPWRVGPWRAYSDLWVDHYTEGQPDPSDRTPKWEVMPTISTREVVEKIQIAVDRYGAGRRSDPP